MTGWIAQLRASLERRRDARGRSASAGCRLDSARLGFEQSILVLRKAALDHVDSQDHASVALRANLARMTRRARTAG